MATPTGTTSIYQPSAPLPAPSQPLPNSVRLTLPTASGKIIAYRSTPPNPALPTLLLLHGNSSSSHIFRPFFADVAVLGVNILAFDYPGHGESDNAIGDTWRDAYTQVGYANIALSLLKTHAPSSRLLVLGWSLGGHVAIELSAMLSSYSTSTSSSPSIEPPLSILITGTPPVAPTLTSASQGFKAHALAPLFSQESLSESEAVALAAGIVVAPKTTPSWLSDSEEGRGELGWMVAGAARTDGRARARMFESFLQAGDEDGVDQKGWIERETAREDGVVVAVVNGVGEPFINLAFVRDGVEWGRGLWRNECFELPDAAHCCFWENWNRFRPLLQEWIGDFAAKK